MAEISIILNVHREIGYFQRTTASIEMAVRHAALEGHSCELVVVADRPEDATLDWFNNYQATCYSRIHVITVDNGSLGLSRNDGISVAQGQYILTADADDLISINTITASLAAAEAFPGPALFFPEYYYAFGFEPHLYQMHPVDQVSPLAMVGSHPFVSRFFARKSDLKDIFYSDLKISSGFAYEDWHYNMKAMAAGLDLRIAEGVTVYYLQRAGSLMRQASQISLNLTDYSDFFKPDVYLPLLDKYPEIVPARYLIDSGSILQNFCRKSLQVEMLYLAANIDPSIDPLMLQQLHAFSNLGGSRSAGHFWRLICERLQHKRYDEVVFMPFMSAGGGEKYILNILSELHDSPNKPCILIVSGEDYQSHHGIEKLPERIDFIDINRLCKEAYCDPSRIDEIALRIVQTFAPQARLHLKVSQFALRFLDKFGALLGNSFIYYRFCDSHNFVNGRWIRSGWEFKEIVKNGAYVDRFICDNYSILEFDTTRIDHLKDRYHVIYNSAEPSLFGRAGGAGVRRILWASRLDKQKRPDLLADIAIRLMDTCPDVIIDVWGDAVFYDQDISSLTGLQNVKLKGGYNGFSSIPLEDYGIFLYTTAFDGLPNVILEALVSGLAIVAPDVGGVSEIINSDTGWLIPSLPDRGALANAYASAINQCLDNPVQWKSKIDAALIEFDQQHSQLAFKQRVGEIFQ